MLEAQVREAKAEALEEVAQWIPAHDCSCDLWLQKQARRLRGEEG